jgi:hypothetical protein
VVDSLQVRLRDFAIAKDSYMTGAKTIGCINHPGIEAIGRCRQCSKPVCRECGVAGTKGIYCCEMCRDKHEQFMQRAQALELDKGYQRGFFFHFRQWLGALITIVVLLFAAGFVSSIIYIPFISDATMRVRTLLGF